MSGSSSSSGLCHSKGPSAWRSNASTEPSSGLKKCGTSATSRAPRATPTRGRFEGRDTGFDALSASAAAAAGSSTLDACRPDLAGGFAGIAPATRGADLRCPRRDSFVTFQGRDEVSRRRVRRRVLFRERAGITTLRAFRGRAIKSYRYVRTHRIPEAGTRSRLKERRVRSRRRYSYGAGNERRVKKDSFAPRRSVDDGSPRRRPARCGPAILRASSTTSARGKA